MNTEAILLQYIRVINRQQDNMNNIIRATQRQTDNLSAILLEYLNDRRILASMLRRQDTHLRPQPPVSPLQPPSRPHPPRPLSQPPSRPPPSIQPPQPPPQPPPPSLQTPRPPPPPRPPPQLPLYPRSSPHPPSRSSPLPQLDSVITPIVSPPRPPPPPPDSIFQFSVPTSDASTTTPFRTRNTISASPLFTRRRPLSHIRTHRRIRFPSLPGFSTADSDVGQDILNATMNDSPVRIRPSLSQIRRATRLSIFRNIEHEEESICPIDREILNEDDTVLQIIHCGHYFRESNLRIHFTMSTRCPLCRFDIREYILDYSERRNNESIFPYRPLEIPSVDVENPFTTLPSANINPSLQTTNELQAISNTLNRLDNSGNIISIEYSSSLATENDTRAHID